MIGNSFRIMVLFSLRRSTLDFGRLEPLHSFNYFLVSPGLPGIPGGPLTAIDCIEEQGDEVVSPLAVLPQLNMRMIKQTKPFTNECFIFL